MYVRCITITRIRRFKEHNNVLVVVIFTYSYKTCLQEFWKLSLPIFENGNKNMFFVCSASWFASEFIETLHEMFSCYYMYSNVCSRCSVFCVFVLFISVPLVSESYQLSSVLGIAQYSSSL